MIPRNRINSAIFAAALIVFLIFIGCDGQKGQLEESKDKVVEKADDLLSEAARKSEKLGDKVEEKTAELMDAEPFKGTWVGTLDSRKTTLVIAGQTGNAIEGKITINYRTPINQEVKGTYDPASKKLHLEDQLHSRYKGKYDGQISEDGSTFSGTFTTLVDKKSYKFSLSKN